MNYETRLEKEQPMLDDYADEAPPPKRRLWLWLGLALLALIAIGVAVAYQQKANADAATNTGTVGGTGGKSAKEAEQAPSISVFMPGRTMVEGVISATGTLAARREMPIGVAGEGGMVDRVLVEAGQWVGAGQVLAVIDRSVQSQQAESQSAQIQVAQADARLAQANLDRALRLVDRGFISRADVDRLTATRDASNARVRVARSQLGELQARSARLNIVAPAAGMILERNVEPGQVVGAGSGVLFRMARGGEMELMAQLSENDLAGLSNGVIAKVTPTGSAQSFDGQIWQIDPVINPQTRQGVARIALPYNNALRPGGFASASIRNGSQMAPVLPESAIQSDQQGSYVYIVDNDNKVQRRPIKLGVVNSAGIPVIEGLDGTERVVMRAAGFLAPGELVNPVLQTERAGQGAAPASPPAVAAPAAAKAVPAKTAG